MVVELLIHVRYVSGAYVTTTIMGTRASSTSSDVAAALSQAEKLFGPALQRVELVCNDGCARSVWRAVSSAESTASPRKRPQA